MILILMGVVGSGKTTIGTLLAKELGWEFVDGDSFHPPANVEKMSHGIALTDADRIPWLQAIRDATLHWISQARNVVLACSALKRNYRELLRVGADVQFVYLKGDYKTISQRLHSRHGHFATGALLASQFADLEEPEDAVTVQVDQEPAKIVADIRRQLGR